MTTATKNKATIVSQSITAATISNRLYHAKECGYKALQAKLAEYRDQGVIIIKFRLNISKDALFAHTDALIAHYDALSTTEAPRKIDIDDDRTLRCVLPQAAIADNIEAMKVGHSDTDVFANIWSINKRCNMMEIQVTPNGAGHYMALAGDAVFLATYFDRPLFTRTVHTRTTGDHLLAATFIDAADVRNYKIRVAELGYWMEIDDRH